MRDLVKLRFCSARWPVRALWAFPWAGTLGRAAQGLAGAVSAGRSEMEPQMQLCVIMPREMVRVRVVIVVILVVAAMVMEGVSVSTAIAVVTAAGVAGSALAGRLAGGSAGGSE